MSGKKEEEKTKDYKKDHEAIQKAITKYISAFENNTDPQVRLAIFQNITSMASGATAIGTRIVEPSMEHYNIKELQAQQAKVESTIIT